MNKVITILTIINTVVLSILCLAILVAFGMLDQLFSSIIQMQDTFITFLQL